MNEKKTPPKDRDLARMTHFIRASGWALPFLCILGIVAGYVHRGVSGAVIGMLTGIAVSLAAGFLVMMLTDVIGGTASGMLFGRRRAVWTVREQVQGTLNQARFSRENSDYEQALGYVNTVLSRDPDYPEALLLKAEILWDGFQELEGAKRFLEKVLTIDFEDRVVYNRAETFYDLLVRTDQPDRRGARPTGLEIGLAGGLGSTFKQIAGNSGNNFKQALAERRAVDWAVIVAALAVSVSLLLFFIIVLNLSRLDDSLKPSGQSIERVHRKAADQAQKILEMDAASDRMASQVNRMKKKTP